MGGRAGGGARGGGGAAGKPKYTYLAESDKAVKVKLSMYAEYAPQGGFVSSMVRDKTINTEVWIPKSQMVKGEPTTWIMNAKATEIAERFTPMNGRVLSKSATFMDANNKVFKGSESAMSRKIRLEKQKKFNAGVKKHDALVAQAKAMGIKGIHSHMKSSTLQGLIAKNTPK